MIKVPFSFTNIIKAASFCSSDKEILSHTRGEADISTQGSRTSEKKLLEDFYPCFPHFSESAIA